MEQILLGYVLCISFRPIFVQYLVVDPNKDVK